MEYTNEENATGPAKRPTSPSAPDRILGTTNPADSAESTATTPSVVSAPTTSASGPNPITAMTTAVVAPTTEPSPSTNATRPKRRSRNNSDCGTDPRATINHAGAPSARRRAVSAPK